MTPQEPVEGICLVVLLLASKTETVASRKLVFQVNMQTAIKVGLRPISSSSSCTSTLVLTLVPLLQPALETMQERNIS